jgi:hypothetical protein
MSTVTLPIEAPAGSLADRAVIVNLSISQWSAKTTDKKVNREVATAHGSEESMGNYRKSLVAKEAIQKYTKLAGEIRAEHYKLSLPWRDTGDRILSSAGYFEYAETMRKRQAEIEAIWDEFCASYPDYVDQARVKLNGLFNPADYPEAKAIRTKYAFKLEVLPVSQADDFRVNLGAEETERLKQRLAADSSAQIARAMSDVWARMRDVISAMSDRLKLYKQTAEGVQNPFRDSLVTNITDLLQIIPILNLTEDPNVSQFAAAMNDELTRYSPEQLRNSQMRRDDIAKRADEILAKMSAFIA